MSTYRDQLAKNQFLVRLLGGGLAASFAVNLLTGTLGILLFFGYRNVQEEKHKNTIVKLVPISVPGPIELGGGDGEILPSYVMGIARRVVKLQENWSWLTIRENYGEIYEYHASLRFENFLKANLAKTGFVDKVIRNKMLSVFTFDKDKSKAGWCKELNAACAVITGTRTVYTDGNTPMDSKMVSYFLLSNAIYPTKETPNVLQVERLIIVDRGESPQSQTFKMFDAAMRGQLPET